MTASTSLRRIGASVTVAFVLAACGGAQTSAPEPGEPTASESTAESDAASVTPSPSELVELSLPDDLTLEGVGDSTVTGVARFAQLTPDQISISIGDVQSDFDSPLGFAVLLLPGTCAEQSEPANFDDALDVETFDEGETPAFLMGPEEIGAILDSPHSILVTNGPGDQNLACADVGI